MKKIHKILRIAYGDITFSATDKPGLRIGWHKCNLTVILSFTGFFSTLEMGINHGGNTGFTKRGIPSIVRGRYEIFTHTIAHFTQRFQ
jgi:hypothetical protein